MRRTRTGAVRAAAGVLVLVAGMLQAEAAGASGAPFRSRQRTVQAAAAPDATIGVDNASPKGHNFQYTSFYPTSAVSVQLMRRTTCIPSPDNERAANGANRIVCIDHSGHRLY